MTTGPAAAPGDVEARLAEGICRWDHSRRYLVDSPPPCQKCSRIAATLVPIVADEAARAVEPFKALADEYDARYGPWWRAASVETPDRTIHEAKP